MKSLPATRAGSFGIHRPCGQVIVRAICVMQAGPVQALNGLMAALHGAIGRWASLVINVPVIPCR